mgnify:CR=1 FL=1
MASRNIDTIEGFRKRSFSETDTDRITETPLASGFDGSNRRILITDLELHHHASSPDISSPGSGLVDTPLGLGRGTRLRSGRNLPSFGIEDKLANECAKIKKDVDSWMLTLKANPLPPLSISFMNLMSCIKGE